MANPKLITFYISQVVLPIMDKLNEDMVEVYTKEWVDTILKANAKIDMSKIEMDDEQLKDLIEHSKQFAMQIGIDIDKGNGIELNFN